MKINRSKNAIRNIKYSVISRIVELIGPFVVRTVFIYSLGSEYLGVNSLFSSILSVLSLTELGFGSAIIYSMFKAIGNDDTKSINALLAYYKKVYHCVGIVIGTLGLMILPFLQQLVHGSYPSNINANVVYLIFLGNTVISYFMFAYKSAIISAFQRDDLIQKINIIIRTLMYTFQMLLLLYIRSYYAYIIVIPTFTILSNIRTAVIVKKHFPKYRPEGLLSSEQKKDLREKISGLVISKFGDVSRNSFDSICISMYLGLTQIAIYNNHYFIMQSVIVFLLMLTGSISAGVGNSVATETEEKNFDDMSKLDFLYMRITGWCAICLMCLYQPFMRIWLGEESIFPIGVVSLFCVYFYATRMNNVMMIYYTANGLWWRGRIWTIIESIVNIVLNFVLCRYIGIYGVLISTITTICFVNFIANSKILFNTYFTNQKISVFFNRHLVYALCTVLVGCVTFAFTIAIHLICGNILEFAFNGIICLIIPNLIYKLLYSRTKMRDESLAWLCCRLPQKMHPMLYLFL